MSRKHRNVYDSLVVYSPDEIYQMYLSDGISPEIARERAVKVSKFINYSVKEENAKWRKVREREINLGLEVPNL